MKKLLSILLFLLMIPSSVFAISSSVDRITDHIEPLIKTDFIQGAYFIATTTTNSIFPNFLFTNATGTAFAVSGIASTTSLWGTTINGFHLSTCTGTNALTWSGGSFSCTAQPQGTVTSVSGTTNRITSTGGATPIIDISAAYVGQASITTIGTLSSGAVPASLVTAGTFGSGDYIFPANLTVLGSTTLQNFTFSNATGTSATTTNLFSTNASTTNLFLATGSGCLSVTSGTGKVTANGLTCGSAYPFPLAGNATSTLTQFNGGITAYATSTIGDGTQFGGLSVNGGATTSLNAYIGGKLNIATTTTNLAQLTVESGSKTTNSFFTGDVNNFLEVMVQNRNSGGSASSDFVATSDNGTASTHYINMGINGSTGGAAPFTAANHAYLYASDDTLNIGAIGTGAELRFFTGGGTTAPNQRLTIANNGRVGVGTTTPWGTFSVASSTYNYIDPIFVVATSTVPTGQLFVVTSTTTAPVDSTGTTTSSGVRVQIGEPQKLYNQSIPPPGNLFVNGTSEMGYTLNQCVFGTGSLSTDTTRACGDWNFNEDTNQTLSVSSGGHDAASSLQSANPSGNDDGGMMSFGTAISSNNHQMGNNPMMESIVKVQPAATGTAYYIGMTNQVGSSASLEIPPSVGCYFYATTTTPNWQAICRTSAANQTIVDTGVASSTVIGGVSSTAGSFYKLRMNFYSGFVDFWLALGDTTNWLFYTRITTNVPTGTTGLTPSIYYGFSSGGSGINNLRFFTWHYIKLWLKNDIQL